MEKMINNQPQVSKPQGLNVHNGAKNLHQMLRASTDDFSGQAPLKKSALPSLSDFVYPVLLDCDPSQEVDEEYKHKHDLLFSWRMLKQISAVDIANFSRSKQMPAGTGNDQQAADSQAPKRKMWTFEGDIEEQAMLLHEKCMKKEIPAAAENQDDEDMEEEKTERPLENEQAAQADSDLKMDEEAIIGENANTEEEKAKEE